MDLHFNNKYMLNIETKCLWYVWWTVIEISLAVHNRYHPKMFCPARLDHKVVGKYRHSSIMHQFMIGYTWKWNIDRGKFDRDNLFRKKSMSLLPLPEYLHGYHVTLTKLLRLSIFTNVQF